MKILILIWGRSRTKEIHISLLGCVLGIFALFLAAIFSLYILMKFSINAKHLLINEEFGHTGKSIQRVDDYEEKLYELQFQLEDAERRLRNLDLLKERNLKYPKLPPKNAVDQPPMSTSSNSFGVRVDQTLGQSELFLAKLELAEKKLQYEVAKNSSFISLDSPLPGAKIITSQYGYRLDPFTHLLSWHNGIDISAKPGAIILAAADGIVKRAGWVGGYGYLVEIEHANHLVTRYAHVQELFVSQGQHVKSQQMIAKLGSTGRSTGPHLHYEVLDSRVTSS